MADGSNHRQIIFLQRVFGYLHVTPTILEKPRHDPFAISVDMHRNGVLRTSVRSSDHEMILPLQARRTSRSVCILIGFVIWALQPASSILIPSSLSASAVNAITCMGGRSCSRSQARIALVAS